MKEGGMQTKLLHMLVLTMWFVATGCTGKASRDDSASVAALPDPGVSISLASRAPLYNVSEVPQGAVGFTASITNDGATAITIAHPSICRPADYNGAPRHFSESHGKSEILLKIEKPDGTRTVLRQRYTSHFDPGNVGFLIIQPGEIRTFHLGWFFENQQEKWEGGAAATVFLMKGKYRVRILYRNAFPIAYWYDMAAKSPKVVDVWTGEMKSPECILEVR
jgi:hypothetical protein